MDQRVKLKSTRDKVDSIVKSQTEESMSDIFALNNKQTFTNDKPTERDGVKMWGQKSKK